MDIFLKFHLIWCTLKLFVFFSCGPKWSLHQIFWFSQRKGNDLWAYRLPTSTGHSEPHSRWLDRRRRSPTVWSPTQHSPRAIYDDQFYVALWLDLRQSGQTFIVAWNPNGDRIFRFEFGYRPLKMPLKFFKNFFMFLLFRGNEFDSVIN